MNVLLIHPPWLRFFGGSLSIAPMALNYIASYIKQELPRINLDVYNADHSDSLDPLFSSHVYAQKHTTYIKRLNDLQDPLWEELRLTLSRRAPDLIGISAMTASYLAALQISRIAKSLNPRIKIVMGGKHPSALPEATLANDTVDIVVIGEGEATFKELLQQRGNPEGIAGLAYRDDQGNIIKTPARAYLEDINVLPIPIFKSSLNTYDFERGRRLASYKWRIIGARGCPFKCIYCASDKKIRFRSPENIIAEIAYVKNHYGIRSFRFEDDSFSLKRDRAFHLCKLLEQEKIKWECNTRVDLLDEALVQAMQKSGCSLVWLGVETGSAATARIIKKHISLEMVAAAIRLFKKFNILVCGYFMIGFPWENRTDMEQTLAAIRKLPFDDFELNLTTPLPGTELFANLVAEGKIDITTEDWSRYHQGSPDMNFSSFPDAEWQQIVLDLTSQAARLHKKRMVLKTGKLLLKNPIETLRRVKNRLAR